MNRRNRSRAVAAAWVEIREEELEARDRAVERRTVAIAAGAQWTPQIVSEQIVSGYMTGLLEPHYKPARDTALVMAADIRRGQRREKKCAAAIRTGGSKPIRTFTTTREDHREYHFAPSPFSGQARTK